MAAAAIPKPQLRRLLEKDLKKHLIGALIVSSLSGLIWKYTVGEPRKKQYADFYKTYDAQRYFQRMCVAGIMQSCSEKDFPDYKRKYPNDLKFL